MGLSTEELEGVPNPGDVVASKYRVDRLLGVGGMGAVVQATHTGLGQRVAIKFLLAEMALNPNSVTRFMREAQSAATIQSDHVVRVSDIGTLDNGTPYMVMEFLDGEDMSDTVSRGPLAVDEAVRYVLQAGEALAEAHKMGIIHRDLKPANLFLARRPDGTARVKVLDFGISKIVAGEGADLTRTTALMGSPVYMAPEQMESAKNADARSDVWALGTILYELVTGTLPFIGETLPEICTKILQAEPPTLTETRPDAPPGLQECIQRALTKKPDNRYQNLAEFALELAPLGGEEAYRSAETICRVLGVTPPPEWKTGAPVPRPAIGSSPGIASAAMMGAASISSPGGVSVVSAAAAGSMVAPSGLAPPGTDPGLGPAAPGLGQGAMSAAAPGPMAPGSAVQPGMAAAQTFPSMDQPGGAPVAMTAQARQGALAIGGSTAAPVSQTMDGMMPRRPRTGLIVGVAAACLVLGGGIAAAVALSGGTSESAAAAAAATAEPSGDAETTEDSTTAEGDTSSLVDTADEDADAGETEPEDSATRAAQTATPAPKPLRKPWRPLRPRPKGQRPGDELF